jgi:hypothetical protein
MTARDAESRPSATAVATALHDRSAAGMPSETTAILVRRPVHRGPDRRRSRRWALAAAGLALVVGSGATVAALVGDDLRVADPTAPQPAGHLARDDLRLRDPRPRHPHHPRGRGRPSPPSPGAHGKGHGPKRPDDKGPQGPKK